MTDTKSERLLMQLHPKLRSIALGAYRQSVIETPIGCHPVITQTLRTFAEQNRLYAQGRFTPGSIVTFSKAGQSYHNYGLGIDFVITVSGKYIWKVDDNWLTVVEIFRSYGFECGIDWKGKKRDAPHFQMRFGYNWEDLLFAYNRKNFIPGTKYVLL